ncbi:MAG: M24 family metallopeptidase [Chitinophagaceae bacterium]
MDTLQSLIAAEGKAAQLFAAIEHLELLQAGKTERELNKQVYELAAKLFGIRKYWHKRIVRSGRNTLLPYRENPPDLTLQPDDIVFFDFGPVFEEWEADFGRTYVLGNNPEKLRLKNDAEAAWHRGKAFFETNRDTLTAAQLYAFTCEMARSYGWEYGNEHCGHLIGNFPHEELIGDELIHYLHPGNERLLCAPGDEGQELYWIYEIHFISPEQESGAFFEQLLG